MQRAVSVLDCLVFCCLLALIVLVTVPYGTVDSWWEAIFESAVFALTAVWILESLLRGDWRAGNFLVLLPIMLLTAYAFLQTVNLPFLIKSADGPITQHSLSIDIYQTHLTAVKMLALTLLTVLLLQHVTTKNRLKWLVRTIIGVGFGSAIFGIMRQLLQSPQATTGFGLPFLFPGFGYAQFLSPNVFAYLVEMVFALVLGLVLGRGIARQHIMLYIVLGVIIWTTLVFSNSRGGLIGFVVESIFLLIVALPSFASRHSGGEFGPFQRLAGFMQSSVLIRVFAIAVIVLTLVVAVFWMGGQQLASKVDQKDSVNETIEGTNRKEIWHSSWQLIKHNPWTGVGFGAYFLAIPQYQVGAGGLKLEEAHNDYLDLAASGGLVAVLLAALFIGVVVWRARSSLRSTDSYRRAAALGALAGLLSVAVHSFVDFGLQITGIAVVAAALIVISIAKIPVRLQG